jgi:hypothetical protein
VAILEDEDDHPERCGERDEVQQRCLDREHERAEGAREQDQRQHDHEGEHVGEVAVDGVYEVAVGRGRSAERRARALQRVVDAVDDGLDAACGAVGRRQFARLSSG